tara:strand:- start:687 stop:1652 length:966 start_codon:yes stop_codon:yes gene_type:complete
MSTASDLREAIDVQVDELIHTYTREIVGQQVHQIEKQVRARIDEVIETIVRNTVTNIDFQPGSISTSSIDWTDFKLTTSNIQDYRKISGIEDLSETVELTLLDGAVVAENSIITKDIITDRLEVNEDLQLSDLIYNSIRDRIINEIPVPEVQKVPEQKDWSFKIGEIEAKIDVNQKRQEHLKQLEVSGEAVLSDVLYTTPGNKRVGINTLEPSDALTVWDSETEVVIGKHKSQEGYIGTRRRQDLNIGANNKVGIVVRSDGNVEINNLQLTGRMISASDSIPGAAAKTGDLVLNNKPLPGGYIGWVCLDGIKWTGWGKIQE